VENKPVAKATGIPSAQDMRPEGPLESE